MEIQCFAKINLCLDITGIRGDGMHELDMLMLAVDLHDTLHVQKSKRIEVCSSVPVPENNTVAKAARAFFSYTGIDGGVQARIVKRIPQGAGLGGGSSDAAGAIAALDALYGTDLDKRQMQEIGLSAGADVPFFFTGGLCRIRGIGDIVTPLPHVPDFPILLIKPEQGVNTAGAYRLYDEIGGAHPNTQEAANALTAGNAAAYFSAAGNSLYAAAKRLCPSVVKARTDLLESSAEFALMSGSGSSVFGVFKDNERARKAERALGSANALCRRVFGIKYGVRFRKENKTFGGARR